MGTIKKTKNLQKNKVSDTEKFSDSIEIGMHRITEMIGEDVSDLLYISEKVHLPEKKDIKRCYWTDFRLITNQEAKRLCKRKKNVCTGKVHDTNQFFVYNERSNELVPFKKNDYLMNEKEYMTFDGDKYLYFDNDGNFQGYMTMKGNTCSYYDKNDEVLYEETVSDHEEEVDVEELFPSKKNKKQQ